MSEIKENKRILCFTAKKGIVGLLLGFTAFYICQRYYHSPRFGILFAMLFVLPGFFCLEVKSGKWRMALQYGWGLAVLAICCGAALYVIRNLFYEKGLFDLGALRLVCNFLLSVVVCCIIYLLVGRWALSVSISSFTVILLALIDGFVIQFRGREICVDDLLSVSTAISVAGEYTYFVPAYMAFCFVLWTLLLFLWFSIPTFPQIRKLRQRLAALAAALVAFFTMHFASCNIQTYYWGVSGSVYNGLYLNMYLGFRDSFVKAPEGYSPENVDNLIAEYTDEQTVSSEEDYPNVIVIMNESFADFESFYKPPVFSKPLTPYIDSLDDNLIQGKALCSVYGGNTANSEFEFLMGHTMAFFPNSVTVIPYQQYLGEEVYSLPHLMRSLGYDTFATHPYKPGGWQRDSRYPTFGFSEITFIDDYPQQKLLRNYVSDREMYEYVLDKLCDNEQKAPMFIFGITMQNHGGYEYKGTDFSETVKIVGCEGKYPMAEQYLSLINESDKALQFFIENLKDFEENTVLLLFGDHLPKIEEDFYAQINGGTVDSLEEQQVMHSVPFYIWANYDIPEYEVELTSLNYLSRYLLEAEKIDLPPYYRFLKDTETVIPAINSYGYYSVSKQKYISLDEAEKEEALALQNYELIQYNNIFDKRNRNYAAFDSYIIP